ncbi:MAG: hdfR 3 [Holophagaceae bacterium]|nr:hdfR 3 [Holophagaceae bacterium]
MDRRQLRCFLALGEHLQFTRAAQAIGLTQPGMSYQLASLEADLGLTLISRVGRQVHFTPSGGLLFRELKRLCLGYRDLLTACRAAAPGERRGEADVLPDFRRLQAFLVLARRLNFTKAAAELNLTQSALSYRITELERAMGCRLFLRSSRVVELTEGGYACFRMVEPLLLAYEEVLRRCQCLASQEAGSLTLGFLGGIEMYYLPGILREFARIQPATQVQMRYLTLAAMMPAILGGEIDCGFTILFDHAYPEGVEVVPLRQERRLVMVAPDHPLARAGSLRLKDLKGFQLLSLSSELSGYGMDFDRQLFARHGLDHDKALLFSDFPSFVVAIESGQGVAIQPRDTTDGHGGQRLVGVELEDPEMAFEYALAWAIPGDRQGLQAFCDLAVAMIPGANPG